MGRRPYKLNKLIIMIPYFEAIKQIEYNFDSIGVTSAVTVLDHDFGELNFHWFANKTKIKITFIDTDAICICGKNDEFMSCDCDWIAFQEGEAYPEKVFTKKQFEDVKKPSLF